MHSAPHIYVQSVEQYKAKHENNQHFCNNANEWDCVKSQKQQMKPKQKHNTLAQRLQAFVFVLGRHCANTPMCDL